jgi:hypothetical protein
MPASKALKLPRHKAATMSVVDTWCAGHCVGCRGTRKTNNSHATAHRLPLSARLSSKALIKPSVPLALRLQAMLLNGIVMLYNRQLVLLYGTRLRQTQAPLAILGASNTHSLWASYSHHGQMMPTRRCPACRAWPLRLRQARRTRR